MGREKYPVRDRAEWLARRAADLTASDIAAAAGLDPYKSRLQLYGEKTGMLLPLADTPLMRRGRWLETAVLTALREEHPDWEIRPCGLYLRDSELRIGATPDLVAVTDEPGVTNIQCKVVSAPVFERDWQDGPPLGYQLQTITEGWMLDAARSYIAALVISTYTAELHLFPVPRHEAAEQRIVEIAAAFWRSVEEGRLPPADYSRDAEIIEQMHPTSVAEPVLDLSGDNRIGVLLPELAALKSGMAIDKKRVAELEAEVKAKLGDAERAELPGWKISWKTQTRKEHVVKESSFRVLRITDLEDKEEAA